MCHPSVESNRRNQLTDLQKLIELRDDVQKVFNKPLVDSPIMARAVSFQMQLIISGCVLWDELIICLLLENQAAKTFDST